VKNPTPPSSRGPEIEKKPGSRFRDWLVEKVSRTGFMVYKDDSDEDIAGRIGVQPEVIQEARARYDARMIEERLPEGQKLGRRHIFKRHTNERELFLEPPQKIFEDWCARRDAQRLTTAVLLRSIVHLVLQSKTQPAWIRVSSRRAWIYRGEWLMREESRSKESRRCRLTTALSEGADLALRLRAERTRVSMSAIARWGVCLFVNDKLQTREMPLRIVPAPHAMYKNATDYCLDPIVTD
jgi:hypothetical protein